VSASLAEDDRAWRLNEAALMLRALGRLTEALAPMRVPREMDVEAQQWKGATISYSNLSELEVTLGQLPEAVDEARTAVAQADRSGDAFQRLAKRATAAALHQWSGVVPMAARASTGAAGTAGRAAGQATSPATAAGPAPHPAGSTRAAPPASAAWAEAGALFGAAERMQREMQAQFPLLYSLRGFRYCNLLLNAGHGQC